MGSEDVGLLLLLLLDERIGNVTEQGGITGSKSCEFVRYSDYESS